MYGQQARNMTHLTVSVSGGASPQASEDFSQFINRYCSQPAMHSQGRDILVHWSSSEKRF